MIYKSLFAVVGLRTYLPYMAVLLALHVLSAHLLWRIMRRAGANPWVAGATAAIFLVLGTGAENLLWAFQIGFVGALAAGLGMILAVLDSTPRRLVAAWLFGVASLMFSGLGPIMVAIAGLTVLLRSGWRRALLTVSIPALVYSVWLLAFGLNRSTRALPHGSLAQVPDYVYTGITSAAAAITGLRFVGALFLVPLALWLLMRAWRSRDDAAVVALAAGTVLFFLVVGVGRVGLGVGEARTSRYVYISAVLLLPAAAVALSHLTRRHAVVAAAVALGLAGSGLHNALALRQAVQVANGMRGHTEARIILASHFVHRMTLAAPETQPEPMDSPDLTWSDMVYLVDMHDLPLRSEIPPSTFDTVSVAASLQMTSSPVPLLPVGATAIRPASNVFLAPAAPGCLAATGRRPGVQLVFGRSASVLIHAPPGSVITAHLRLSVSSTVDAPPHPFAVDATGTLYVDVSLAGAAPILDLPPAGAVLCGVSVA